MKIRKPIPYKTKAILQKEIGSVCPFCLNKDVEHFEIHHIDENPENNHLANLIMLCPICHSKITKGDINKNEVIKIKRKVSGETESKLPKEIKELIEKGTKVRNESKFTEAGAIYLEALELAEKLNDQFAIAKCKLKIASTLNDKHEFPQEALKYIKDAETYFRENYCEKDLASALYESSVSELMIDGFDEARIHLKEAVDIYIKLKDKFHEGTCYFQMGWMEHGQGHLIKSKELYHNAIAIFENEYSKEDTKLISARIAACYAHMALVNKAEMNLADAETNLLKSLEYFERGDLKISIGQSLFFLGELRVKTQQIESGKQYLRKALIIFQEVKEYRLLAQALDLLSKIEYTFGDKQKAVEIFLKAIEAIEQTSDIKNKIKYYGKLAELYKIEKMYPDAEKLNIQIKELAEKEKDDEEYYHAVLGLIDIKKEAGKKAERNAIGKEGIEYLKVALIKAQREAKRAHLLGDIASIYTECENYFEAKKYFSLAKDAFIILSDKNGISKCLGAIAYIYQLEGNYQKEVDTYSELKQLTEGSRNYYAHAASIFNLCMYEINNENFELARKYFSEVEYLNYNYGLDLEEKLDQLESILNLAVDANSKPEMSIKELMEDFYSEVNFYPKERIHHLRLWIFCHGNELFANYRYLEGLKFLVVTDDTDLFLNLSSELNTIGELFLQTFSTNFETGKAVIFHYPKERLIPKGISLMVTQKGDSEENTDNKNFSFSKKTKEEYEEERENDYLLKRSHASKLTNYMLTLVEDTPTTEYEKQKEQAKDMGFELADYPGNLILAYPIIFPKPFEDLLLTLSAEEILKQKIFFDISDRGGRKDKFSSDLRFAKQLNLIPIYLGELPKSDKTAVIETVKIEMPIYGQEFIQKQTSDINKIKTLLTKFCINIDNAKSSLENLKIEITEVTEKVSLPKLCFDAYILNLLSLEEKEKVLVLVLRSRQ